MEKHGLIPGFTYVGPTTTLFSHGLTKMKNLPVGSSVITPLPDHLRQGYDVRKLGSKVSVVAYNAGFLTPQTGQERSATGVADGILSIRPLKQHTTLRQSINVRRLHHRVAITTNRISQVISNDKKNVKTSRPRAVTDSHRSQEDSQYQISHR
jgi:hypothetical protein